MYVRIFKDRVDEKEFNGDDETQKMLSEYGWFPKDRKMPEQFSAPKADFTVEELQAMLASKMPKLEGLEPEAEKTFTTVMEDVNKVNTPKKRRTNAEIARDKALK